MPSRRKIFTCKPAAGAEERCARQIIATLVRRAYRGQGTDADVERLMGFCRAGRQQRDFDRGIQVALQRVLASPKFVFRARARTWSNFPRVAPIVSAISSWRRVSRSSSGAASPTMNCSRRRRENRLQDAGRARAPGSPHARRSEVGALRGQLCRPVAVSAEPVESSAEFDGVPRFRRQPASGVLARGGALLREHRARGPQRARPDDRRLHVRQRTARAALRHPERVRQPVPARDVDRRGAQGAARQGRDPDGDVARHAHLTGRARQVDPGQHPQRAAAAAAGQRAAAAGRPRSRGACCRCGSAWKHTARIRSARTAIGSSIQSGSRWRTSMPSDGWRARDGGSLGVPSTHRASCWTARRWTAWSRFGARCCAGRSCSSEPSSRS